MQNLDITIDELGEFDAAQHQTAIEHYDALISALLAAPMPPDQRELTILYDLRRLHQQCRADLLTETEFSHSQAA
jgi:hypothetical protein